MANTRRTRTEIGSAFNEGARLLWKALDRRGWTQADLRRRLHGPRRADGTIPILATGQVSRWLYGDRKPDIEIIAQIEDLFWDSEHGVSEVPATAWARSPSRRFVPPALKRTGTDG